MAFKPTVGYIADAFQSSFRQKIEQAQREREFAQKMAEEQRQSSLLDYWKRKDFEADQAYRGSVLENQRVDNERQGKVADAQLKNYELDNKLALDKFEWDKKQDAIRTGILAKNNIGTPVVTSPGDFSKGFGLLGKAWNNYDQTRKPTYDTDTEDYYVSKGLGEKMVGYKKNDIKSLRQDQLNNVINESNSLVKEINASYPGFEQHFKTAFQKIKNPNSINAYVDSIKDKQGNKLPTHLQDWLKEILNKRIF